MYASEGRSRELACTRRRSRYVWFPSIFEPDPLRTQNQEILGSAGYLLESQKQEVQGKLFFRKEHANEYVTDLKIIKRRNSQVFRCRWELMNGKWRRSEFLNEENRHVFSPHLIDK